MMTFSGVFDGFRTYYLKIQHMKELKLKELSKIDSSKKVTWTFCLPFFLKQVIKLPCERYSPCTRRKEDILITRDRGFCFRKVTQTHLVKLTLSFPVTSRYLLSPAHNPASCQFTNLLSFCPKGIKIFLLWSLLLVFILLWNLLDICKNLLTSV